MPLWYVLRPRSAELAATPARPGGDRSGDAELDVRIWAWTYAASQKVRNLERDPRATLQVEAGESYEQLRGVTLECEVLVHRGLKAVTALGREIFKRYASARGEPPAQDLGSEVTGVIAGQARKRVGLEFAERRRASWDHRKLGGVY
jgi:hypothetical protein